MSKVHRKCMERASKGVRRHVRESAGKKHETSRTSNELRSSVEPCEIRGSRGISITFRIMDDHGDFRRRRRNDPKLFGAQLKHFAYSLYPERPHQQKKRITQIEGLRSPSPLEVPLSLFSKGFEGFKAVEYLVTCRLFLPCPSA